MDKKKRKRLEAAGWAVGDAKEFLGLSEAEESMIEIRLAFAEVLAKVRKQRRFSQKQLADLLGSSQSRVSKMESAHPTVSLDLIMQALLNLGVTRVEIGHAITGKRLESGAPKKLENVAR